MSPAMIAIGDTAKARDYAGAAIEIARALQRDEPQKLEWRKLDAEANATLGIAAFWAGDPAVAHRENEKSIKEFKELATVAPDDLSIPEKMMAVYEASGDTERSMGNFDGASAAYRDWLALSDDLVKRVSDSTEADFWRSFGADAHLRLGDMQFQAKNYTDAAAEYRQGLTVAQTLHDKEPGNAKFLEHLSLAHGKLSDALISSNNLDQAMQEVALNISLSDDLVDEFASNVRWLLYREWAHLRKGHALLALQRYQDAFAEFQQYLKGVEAMRARDPGYVGALYDQSNAHQWMGDALRLAGDVAGAEQQYVDALGFARDAVKLSPASNDPARKIFAFAYYRLGLIDELEGKKSEARAAYEQCGTVKFNNATWTPRSTWPDDVVRSCNDRRAEIAAHPGP
jgi:tetratricopeptide (TPR) repeat protein